MQFGVEYFTQSQIPYAWTHLIARCQTLSQHTPSAALKSEFASTASQLHSNEVTAHHIETATHHLDLHVSPRLSHELCRSVHLKDILLNPMYEGFAAASCNTAICCPSID
jgi:hypothetical protein